MMVFGERIGDLCKSCFVGDFTLLGVVLVGVVDPMCIFAWNTLLDFSLSSNCCCWVCTCWNSTKCFLVLMNRWRVGSCKVAVGIFYSPCWLGRKVLECTTNNSIKHQSFVYTQLTIKTVLFQTIQFSISTQLKCQTVQFEPKKRNLPSAITFCLCGPGTDGNECVLLIHQSSSITGASLSGCFVTNPEHLFKESYSSAEMLSVHSAAPTDLATFVDWRSLTHLQRCRRCILQVQLTWPHSLIGGVSLICRDVVGAFCCPNWLGHICWLEESYPSAEMQLMNSTTPVDRAIIQLV